MLQSVLLSNYHHLLDKCPVRADNESMKKGAGTPPSVACRVALRIRANPDRVWGYADFRDLRASSGAVAMTLSRLARTGELRRVRRGIYYRPGPSVFGESVPDPAEILDRAYRRHGVTTIDTGVGAWRRLGLTTQLSAGRTIAARRRVRLQNMPAGTSVLTRPLSPGMTAPERASLDALRHLNRVPGAAPMEIITRLLALLRAGALDGSRLVRFAMDEPPRVRALVGALVSASPSHAATLERAIERLRKTLNPLTTYRIAGVGTLLPTAASWRIR